MSDERCLDLLDGHHCDDNGVVGYPQACGVYRCAADFVFEQGYCDGYPAPGESDWSFRIVASVPIWTLAEAKGIAP